MIDVAGVFPQDAEHRACLEKIENMPDVALVEQVQTTLKLA